MAAYAGRKHGRKHLRELVMSRLARLASIAFGAMAALMLAGYGERPQVREDRQGRFRDKPEGPAVASASISAEVADGEHELPVRNRSESGSRRDGG